MRYTAKVISLKIGRICGFEILPRVLFVFHGSCNLQFFISLRDCEPVSGHLFESLGYVCGCNQSQIHCLLRNRSVGSVLGFDRMIKLVLLILI